MAQKLAKSVEVNVWIKGHVETSCSPNNQEITQRCTDLLSDGLVTCSHWTSRTGETSNHRHLGVLINHRQRGWTSVPSTVRKISDLPFFSQSFVLHHRSSREAETAINAFLMLEGVDRWRIAASGKSEYSLSTTVEDWSGSKECFVAESGWICFQHFLYLSNRSLGRCDDEDDDIDCLGHDTNVHWSDSSF